MTYLNRKHYGLNRRYFDYKRNPANTNYIKSLKGALTDLALDISPRYPLYGDRYGNLGNILDYMYDFTLSYSGSNFLTDIISAVYHKFSA